MKRSRLNPISDKRRAALRRYKNIEIYLEDNPCAYCGGVATERDHICRGSNRGISLTNTDTMLPLCRKCHREIGDHPIEYKLAYKIKHIKEMVEHYRNCNVDWDKVKGLL